VTNGSWKPGTEDLAALGRIALASTGVQAIVEAMIHELLGVKDVVGRVFTERVGAWRLTEWLKQLAARAVSDAELAAEVAAFADAARVFFKARNDNLHSFWIRTDDGTVARFQSVVIVPHPGQPEIAWDVAIAETGRLDQAADQMEAFGRLANQLLQRVSAASG
jgi:hypothetical protein